MENKANVSTPSPRVAELEEKRALVRAIMSGTFGMRQHKEYLPQHPAESNGVYKTRVQKTFLDNFVGDAVDKANGKIFAKEIQAKDLPAEIETLIENIDRQGRALTPFIMDVAHNAFQDGLSFTMTDLPKTEGVQTLADEKALGIRPYAIHIKPCDVLETLAEMINGVETLTRVRIRETVQELDGWQYEMIDQIRVWLNENGAVRWETYRQTKDVKKEWVLHGEGVTSFKKIYLIPFYTNRVGFCEGEPPFQNIAESTLEHWQWKSEHAHALSMCCFGMYTAAGIPAEAEFKVGPAAAHRSTSPEARWGILETTGVGVTLAESALKNIEARIESAGVDLRVENAGNVTATAAALDSEDTDSGLKAIAGGFSDSIELLFQSFAEIMGLGVDKAGTAEVNDDFGAKKGSDAGLQGLGALRGLGDISRNQIFAEYQRRGELSEDFSAKLNDEELDAEGPPLSSFGKNNQNTN